MRRHVIAHMGRTGKRLSVDLASLLDSLVPVIGDDQTLVQFSISAALKWSNRDEAPDVLLEPQARQKTQRYFGVSV